MDEDDLERPLWRGRLHQIAFFLTLPAGLYLLAEAHTAAARVAVAVYWASLAGLFGASASYHRLGRTPVLTKWLRRLDHSMIFVLIAGTYTPICLLVLPRAWGIPMLVAVWVTALAGVIMKMVRVSTTKGGKSGSWLYIVMGWGAVLVLPQLLSHLDPARIALARSWRVALHRRGRGARTSPARSATGDVRVPRDLARLHDRGGRLPLRPDRAAGQIAIGRR